MSTPFNRRRSARWPFWLLLAAWVSANTPAVAVCALLAWVGEARHFSHQQRLVTDVAFVLAGQAAPGLGVIAAAKTAAQPAPPPTAPSGLELKKIDLAVERAVEVREPAARQTNFVATPRAQPEARRAAPLHEPPRGPAIA